jgi:hypothetical protein
MESSRKMKQIFVPKNLSQPYRKTKKRQSKVYFNIQCNLQSRVTELLKFGEIRELAWYI